MFAAGYLHGFINKSSTSESLNKGTELSAKIIQKLEREFNFFSLKTTFSFFGLTTLGLYLLSDKFFAIKFFSI